MARIRRDLSLYAVRLFSVLALLGAAPAVAQSPEPSSDPIRLLLPGKLADLAVVDDPDGGPVLALLVLDKPEAEDAPGDEPPPSPEALPKPELRLYRLDPAARTITPWSRGKGSADTLPPGSRSLWTGNSDEPLWVAAHRYGSLDLYRIADSSPIAGAPARHHDLPRRAQRRAWGLRLSSPSPRALAGTTKGASPCFATGPEAHGRRLRVLLLCDGNSEEPAEAWVSLPQDERVSETAFGYLDGEPAMAVLTHDKIGPFVQQDLRVFRLAPSRNRLGTGPILAEHTDCPLWRNTDLTFTDVDGDGRSDVLLVCEKGIVDQELRVETYRRSGRDTFDRVRVHQLDGDFDGWRMREDLTGDGRPDLVILDESRLTVYSGSPDRRSPVEPDPAWSAALPPTDEDEDGSTTVQVSVGEDVDVDRWTTGPRLLGATDLDGDGRPEVLVYRSRKDVDVLWITER